MKTLTLRLSVAVLAVTLLGSLGCSTGGCNGTNLNDNSASGQVPATQIRCGQGTYLNSEKKCVPLKKSSNSNSSSNNNANTNTTVTPLTGH
jgi:hypothetical protein